MQWNQGNDLSDHPQKIHLREREEYDEWIQGKVINHYTLENNRFSSHHTKSKKSNMLGCQRELKAVFAMFLLVERK